jgi:hypothetical protein
MTTVSAVNNSSTVLRPRRISRGLVLVLGTFVIPFALNVAFNSYGPLTVDSALRMAFASVAGQTIAILSAILAVILTVRRRYAWPAIAAFVIIAAIITSWAIGNMVSAGDTLLDRLALINEVNELNR